MPLRLVKGRHGSPNWYIRGTIRGCSVDESTGVSDRKKAEEIRIKREAEILERSIHGHAVSRTFAEAATDYMSHGGERKHLAPILALIGKRKLAAIGQAEVDDLAAKLKPGASSGTINRSIYTPVSAVMNHAALKRWCEKPVFSRPKQPPGRVRWITHIEAARLIAVAPAHLKQLVIFLLSTGARLSEALYLNWSDVDLSKRRVVFRETKNGEDRGVPLPTEAVVALANLPWDREGPVFRRPGGRDKNGNVIWQPYADRNGEGGGQVKTAWKTMLKNACIENFTPHDCRHTWATWHYAENRDVAALMKLGGWKSPEMVHRYTHINMDHLAPGQDAIWGKSGKRKKKLAG